MLSCLFFFAPLTFFSHYVFQITDKMAMFNYMRNMTADLVDCEALRQAAFSIDGWSGFSGRAITEKRAKHTQAIEQENRELEARRAV